MTDRVEPNCPTVYIKANSITDDVSFYAKAIIKKYKDEDNKSCDLTITMLMSMVRRSRRGDLKSQRH